MRTTHVEHLQQQTEQNLQQSMQQPHINKPEFSTPKSVDERQAFKAFGNATNITANKNLTTYGDVVYMEYNPALFLGSRGSTYLNKYMKDIASAFGKDEPLKYVITLKSTDLNDKKITVGAHTPKQDECQPTQWDWWGDDDINAKINCEKYNYNPTHNLSTSAITQDLITDVVDKLSVAKKIIGDYRIPVENDGPAPASIIFRDIKPTQSSSTGGLFTPRALQNKAKSSSTDHMNILHIDDNYAIRVSNFTDTFDLTPYDVKDIFVDYIGDIRYNVSIPKDRETNFNKDFAFLNFQCEQDMMAALAALQNQRIYFDSSILCFELSRRKHA
jgi:hypothetical protein